jgi:WD40 repeat protein
MAFFFLCVIRWIDNCNGLPLAPCGIHYYFRTGSISLTEINQICSKLMMILTKGVFQVMGDRMGNIRWWDVTTGHSSSFNTHREGIRRIKFSPFVPGDHSRGRIAVLFYDNTFSVFDLVR